MKLLISAVEPSGDSLGANLIRALRRREPNLQIIGCGGPKLAAHGLKSIFDTAQLSVIGPLSVLKAIPAASRAADLLLQSACDEQPDLAVFIDSWMFSKLTAQRMQKAAPAIKRIKYVAPQVWASRPGRAQKLANLFDGLLCLFEFETSYFEPLGIPVQAVGHSEFQHARSNKGNAARFRKNYGDHDGPLIAVLPGSRKSELRQHIEPFGKILGMIKQHQPRLSVVLPAAQSVTELIPKLIHDWPAPVRIIQSADKYDAFAAADVALAVSGTVTTELAIHGTPMVICYKLDPIAGIWVDLFVTTPYASLINITAQEMVIPEFVQRRFSVPDVTESLLNLLQSDDARRFQKHRFPALIDSLAGDGQPAEDVAANTIIDWVKRKSIENS
ncbi:lipid-A-disaccharide synthase [Hyphococcus flavus]|uniref:Lipid-A-disaccharide synthase n=1 Tax=Hyphococcus flavus TaxID=1866326 RepID=A0AAE9ZAV8_9PROT|nr:lipid-A-disaccharide synthase [Hyphococcus flavus]WDI31044.1 lipid-A-disaccharide synthase [Hyphococcus flavus]